MHRLSLPRLSAVALLAVGTSWAMPARAEVQATGTRLSFAGAAARPYMTYGDLEESELYAPILTPMQRLGVVLQQKGEDFEVYVGGKLAATWPIVTSRQQVPDTGEHPCVLVLGGNTFLPVRALGRLLGARIGSKPGQNLVSFNLPDTRVRPQVAEAGDVNPTLLSKIEVSDGPSGVRIRVETNEPIRPTWSRLQNPPRIVIDFPGGRWSEGLSLPPGSGNVAGVRTGYPRSGVARMTIDLRSADLRLNRLEIRGNGIEAAVGRGQQIADAELDPEVEKMIRALESRRKPPGQLPDRGGQIDTGSGTRQPLLPPIDLNPGPLSPGGLRVAPATSLVGRTICLDAGHGGSDPGALGANSKESSLCLKMTLELKAALEALGATVVLTRRAEVELKPADRVAAVNASGADCTLSIHCNSTPRRNSTSGTETYYYTPQSARLAAALHPRVVAAVRSRDFGIKNHRSFYMIRQPSMPSVLLEIGFINHVDDEALLRDPVFHRRLAASLAQGLLDYFGTDVE